MADNQNNPLITGPLGTDSVFNFNGTIPDAPKASDFNTLIKRVRDLADDKGADDTAAFAARAGQELKTFENQTQQQLDFIKNDNDFSLNQISGFQGQTARLRTRQADALNDAFQTSFDIVQSREQKRMREEEKERQAEMLKDETELSLQLKAAARGIKGVSSMKRDELLDAIAKDVADENVQKLSQQNASGSGGVDTTPTTNFEDFFIPNNTVSGQTNIDGTVTGGQSVNNPISVYL